MSRRCCRQPARVGLCNLLRQAAPAGSCLLPVLAPQLFPGLQARGPAPWGSPSPLGAPADTQTLLGQEGARPAPGDCPHRLLLEGSKQINNQMMSLCFQYLISNLFLNFRNIGVWVVSWDRRTGSLDLAPRGRSRGGTKLCPLCFAPVAQSRQSPACPGLKPSSSSFPETSVFLTPTAQPPQPHCRSAAVQGDAKGLCGGFNGNGTPPGHGHPMDRQHRGAGCGRGCSPAGSTDKPSTAQRVPREPPTPQHPWRVSQTRPAGFRGAGGGLGHQGSRAKAFPRAGEGRMPCQEQHTSVRSPPLPSCKKQGKSPGRLHPEVQPAASSQHPQGMQEMGSRGPCTCWHEWPGSCIAAGCPPMPRGARGYR